MAATSAKQFKNLDEALGWLERYEPTTKGNSAGVTRNRFNVEYFKLYPASKRLIDDLRNDSSYDGRNTLDNQGTATAFRSKVLAEDSEYAGYAPVYSPFDIDADGNVDALTDGMLLLRYLFNLSGNSLLKDAVAKKTALSDGATRTDEEIEQYLRDATGQNNDGVGGAGSKDYDSNYPLIEEIFDIDDSGDVDALTDGLMLIRYLFNLTGKSLADSAIHKDSPFHVDASGVRGNDLARQNIMPFMPGEVEEFVSVDAEGNLVVPKDGLVSTTPTSKNGIEPGQTLQDYKNSSWLAGDENQKSINEFREAYDSVFIDDTETLYEASLRGADINDIFTVLGLLSLETTNRDNDNAVVADFLGLGSAEELLRRFDVNGSGVVTTADATKAAKDEWGPQQEAWQAKENEKNKQELIQKFDTLFVSDEETIYEAYLRGVPADELSTFTLQLYSHAKMKGLEEVIGFSGVTEAEFYRRFDVNGSRNFDGTDALDILSEDFGAQEQAYNDKVAAQQEAEEAARLARGDFIAGDAFPEEDDYPGRTNYSDILTTW